VPLLGWPLLAVLAVVAGMAVTATLVLWGRVTGPRVARGAQRVGLVVLCQLTAVLLLAAAVNDWGYFYGSWSELFGTTSSGAPAARVLGAVPSDGSRAQALAPGHRPTSDAPVTGATTWSSPVQWPTRGRVEALQLTGAHSRLSEPALVYLPPQYFAAADRHRRFPAVEVFTGYPGSTRALVQRMRYPDLLLSQIQAHRAGPMVLVMLRPTVVPPRDTECTDVPAGPQTLTFFGEDVPRAVSATLRVRATGWGAMGDSTGGYCATKIAMTHSSVFSAAVSLSGYYHTLRDRTTGDLWGGSPQLRRLNDLEWLLRNQPAPPVSVFATSGSAEKGPTGIRDLRIFEGLVHPPMSITTETVPGGGHNFASWQRVMPSALDWLSARLGA
jgi:enterochelin esterase-like enzyme